MNRENKYNALRDLDDFILSLNEESHRNSIVIVEGKKDVDALFFLDITETSKLITILEAPRIFLIIFHINIGR